jgi:hypothetical protein
MLSRRRSLIWFAAGVALAAALLFGLRIRRDMVDFAVNYSAGDRLIHGETLYRTTDEHYQFKYSPFCAMIYAPLALLSPTAAKAVWFFFVIAATAGLIILPARLLSGPNGRLAQGAAIGAGLLLMKFIFREIQLGQINAIITALLLLMILNLQNDETKRSPFRIVAAGLLWGLATALKPYAVIFLPYFILKRRWNILWPALLVLGASLFAPAVYYGFAGNLTVHEEWISTLSRSTPGLLASQDNVSILALLVKWTGDRGLSQPIYAFVVLLLAVFVFAFIRRGRGLPKALLPEAALLLLLIPLISPLGWDYTFISAILAVALLLQYFKHFPRLGRIILGANLAVIAFALYDLLGRRLYAGFMTASVPTINFLLLAGFLAYLRRKRKA